MTATPSLPRRVVVIEDDPQMRRFLRTSLSHQGFQVHEADNARQGLIEVGTRKPDLVILDLGLPDQNGVEVVKSIRTWSSLPILVLSARTAEQHKIEALDAGADDYLTKPFGVGELMARLRVALRHGRQTQGTKQGELFVSGPLTVDLEKRLVYLDEREVHLTPIQYRLLTMLVRHAGKVITQRQLLIEVWGPSYVEHAHYLRIYMSQLRQKLEADPAQPQLLLTESGVGYRLKLASSNASDD